MLNLSRPEYSALRTVFGKVLEARSKQPQADCSVLNLLAKKAHPLELLNEDCAIYVREVGLEDTAKKCNRELLGLVERPAREFNGGCGDFWAEMAAIRVLASKGYSRFRPIFTMESDGTTSDYEGYLETAPAHIEVKNMRANKTIVDLFAREIRALYASTPAEYSFNIGVDYPYDDAPSAAQERTIREYVSSLRGGSPPFKEQLDLGDATAWVNVVAGSGTASMIRGIGPE